LDWGGGCGGQCAQNLSVSGWIGTGLGWIFRELCRRDVGVRLGWLPMTRRYLDCITWSLR